MVMIFSKLKQNNDTKTLLELTGNVFKTVSDQKRYVAHLSHKKRSEDKVMKKDSKRESKKKKQK